jgi:hypothetical protein
LVIGTLWVWTADHATVLAAVISAFSTCFIAGFTVSLVRATNKQGALTGKALKLASDEFLATHRPRVIVREVYWEPERADAITVMWGNVGSRAASIVEFRTEFDRTDLRPIMHGGAMVSDWEIARGAFEATTIPLGEKNGFSLAAFQEGLLGAVNFQGLIIYTDDKGTYYRSVFKRVCRQGESVFTRTGNLDDEYSD